MSDPDETCGVNVAFAVVGSKWKPTILWLLGQGPRRFGALRREIGPVSEKVLAAQLRELQRDGVVSRREQPGFPLHVEYSLTEHGRALDAALEALADWGHAHLEVGRRERADAS